jgi:hypothetical integral membrane protein (TIGR02206 family)
MSPTTPAFHAYDASHCIVLALTVLIPALLIGASRRDATQRTERIIRIGLILLMTANMAALIVIGLREGQTDWVDFLPMHLCDWLAFILIGALWTKKQTLFELAYFWGLTGTMQGVLTPDLAYGFPHPYFFTFHIGHSGLITGVLFLALACGLRPHPRSILRAWLWLQVYLITAAVTNSLLGTNFGYLCAKPAHASLVDHLGPWPWYLVSMEVFAALCFGLLYLPYLSGGVAAWIRQRTSR